MEQVNFFIAGSNRRPVDAVPRLSVTKAAATETPFIAGSCGALGAKVRDLGRDHGFTRQHVSDYLNVDDKLQRRSPPAHRIVDFEDLCGNSRGGQ